MAGADFLSTALVIPQSLPVRELGPHSELRPRPTKTDTRRLTQQISQEAELIIRELEIERKRREM